MHVRRRLGPKNTFTFPTKLRPLIVTFVPDFSGPAKGRTLVTVGTPAKVNWSDDGEGASGQFFDHHAEVVCARPWSPAGSRGTGSCSRTRR